jgi:hypothetical protein
MRRLCGAALVLALGLVVSGCGPRKPFTGPTVDAFNGRLTHDGKPVSFPDGESVMLEVYHQTGEKFGIPIRPDGTFRIGWMPIGKYSAMLMRERKSARGAPASRYNIPGGFTIEDGKTEYSIELGKGWQP